MKSKFREKFGTDYQNLTSPVTGEHLYPVKTLVAFGRCKGGKRKGELIFKRAKCSCGAWKYASLRKNWDECKVKGSSLFYDLKVSVALQEWCLPWKM